MSSRIKLVCFDLNKTLIKENTWLDLNVAMGMTEQEDMDLLEKFESGEITYEEGQKVLENIYKERDLADERRIMEVISKYTYLPFGKEIVADLKNKGYEIALISGSIDLLVEKVAGELGIKHFAANNKFVFNKDHYLDKIVTLGNDSETKLLQLLEICSRLKIDIEETACIGDGDNDFKIFEATKHGITFKNSRIESLAWKTIDSLEELKAIFP